MDPSTILIIVIALGGLWLITSRSRKQQKEASRFRDNLAPGQDIMTGSGLFGTITDVEDDVITIETTPGVETRWLRAAIAKVIEPVEDSDQDDEEWDEDDEEWDETDEGEYDPDAEYEESDEEADSSDEDQDSDEGSGRDDARESADEEPVEVPDDLSSLQPDDDEDSKPTTR